MHKLIYKLIYTLLHRGFFTHCISATSVTRTWGITRFTLTSIYPFFIFIPIYRMVIHDTLVVYFKPIFSLLNTVSEATSGTLTFPVQHLCYLQDSIIRKMFSDVSQRFLRTSPGVAATKRVLVGKIYLYFKVHHGIFY